MASLYLGQSVNPKTVAERLGHASVNTTLDLYSHCLPGVQEAAAAQFDMAMKLAGKPQLELRQNDLVSNPLAKPNKQGPQVRLGALFHA